jgi:hypothetical protein
MIAKVRRRWTSEANSGREDDSAETARSDIREPVAGKPGWIKGGLEHPRESGMDTGSR